VREGHPLCDGARLALELAFRAIPLQAQAEPRLEYKGKPVKQAYYPDFICDDLPEGVLAQLLAELEELAGPAAGQRGIGAYAGHLVHAQRQRPPHRTRPPRGKANASG
jgi:hypothetical protein